MPSIKCTKKLAVRCGLKLDSPIDQSPDDWHADIFRIERRSYVIFCQDHSRLSVLSGPVLKSDLQDLPALLRAGLIKILEWEEFHPDSVEYAISKLQPMNIAKTDNRSVLGTIGDNIWHTEVHAYHAGGIEAAGLVGLAAHLNHMPMKPIQYQDAIQVFQRSVFRAA